MNQIIIEAIKNKQLLEFYYKDDLRIVESFVYGISTTGKESLRAFQVGGFSSDSESFGWKLFTVDKMENIRLKEEKFNAVRDNYNPNDSVMHTIYANI
jgi:hypothetical protein